MGEKALSIIEVNKNAEIQFIPNCTEKSKQLSLFLNRQFKFTCHFIDEQTLSQLGHFLQLD